MRLVRPQLPRVSGLDHHPGHGRSRGGFVLPRPARPVRAAPGTLRTTTQQMLGARTFPGGLTSGADRACNSPRWGTVHPNPRTLPIGRIKMQARRTHHRSTTTTHPRLRPRLHPRRSIAASLPSHRSLVGCRPVRVRAAHRPLQAIPSAIRCNCR